MPVALELYRLVRYAQHTPAACADPDSILMILKQGQHLVGAQAVRIVGVVPVADEVKGKVPDLYVSLKPGLEPSAKIADSVSASVVAKIGTIARPHQVIIVPDMPKTRSGKIMRRVLAAVSNHQDPGDVSTLANPEIVERIKELAK